MDYLSLGKSSLRVSRIALGCMSFGLKKRTWYLDEEQSRPLIREAIELGINFFDVANMYSQGASEIVLGRALKDFARREDVVVATKVYFPVGNDPNSGGLSRKAILREVDESLRRLGTDYIDLYQVHRWDHDTPIEETLEALHDVIQAGKVRYIGASSMLAWQFCKALHVADLHGWTRFVSMQPHYNLINREEEREMLPLCQAEGIGVLPWSPLAKGRIARNWKAASTSGREATDEVAKTLYAASEAADEAVINRVVEIAGRRQVPNAQVGLAWLLAQPAITAPIVGVTRSDHLNDAVGAVQVKLDLSELAYLEEAYVPHPLAFGR